VLSGFHESEKPFVILELGHPLGVYRHIYHLADAHHAARTDSTVPRARVLPLPFPSLPSPPAELTGLYDWA